ncbi:MAG: UDP-N-acetylglucosamine 2-epimerase (non-hydrolyzing) [Planctomycetota bacterium]|nr:UDP-N-acetylglucosamine 2-epimerase (non-hydrolyzing) [Planctomycetota bacterium]
MAEVLNFVRVVGARPQFMQAVALRRELLRRGHREILVHTGQHYDESMSKIFFDDLGLDRPDVNLQVGSGDHGAQTGRMMKAIEQYLLENRCDGVIVDGDTNSTLAGALVAVKMQVPLVHVEAGLRSFDMRMPEEVNRIVTDRVADLLCAPTKTAVENLQREGLGANVVRTGDLMYDCFIHFRDRARKAVLEEMNLQPDGYFLATVHRPENTDNHERLENILEALWRLPVPVILPVHPRVGGKIRQFTDRPASLGALRPVDPVGYPEMLALESGAKCIFTDSGGVQREAFFWGKPSVVLRETTEWREILEGGWSILAGWRRDDILDAYDCFDRHCPDIPSQVKDEIFGGGRAAERVVDAMETLLS